MASYCRITGKARGLPKPNYFPLLPPISPADAKRFCRITGKSYGLPGHHYIPVLVGKPKSKKSKQGDKAHVLVSGYTYYFPCTEESEHLTRILNGKKDGPARYIYPVKERSCGLVFSAQLEAAVRDGDVRDVMLATDADVVLLKLKRGGDVSVGVRKLSREEVSGELLQGRGTVARRKPRPTDSMVKIFEDKEKSEENTVQVKRPKPRHWKNVEPATAAGPKLSESVEFEPWRWEEPGPCRGVPISDRPPSPVVLRPKTVDLATSVPGIVQRPAVASDLAGYPVAPVIAPFKPLILDPQTDLTESIRNLEPEQLARTAKAPEIFSKQTEILPEIAEIPRLLEGLKTGSEVVHEVSGKRIHGLKLNIDAASKFVVGQTIETPKGSVFVAGQTVSTPAGDVFVPGFTVKTPEGVKLLPGQTVEVGNESVFIVGQTALTRQGECFVQGQTLSTPEGPKFVPGQTVLTPGGPMFVPGQIIDEKFVPGQTFSTPDGPRFVPGQTVSKEESTVFVAGQSAWSKSGWDFVPGKTVEVNDTPKFVPGKVANPGSENECFVPGQYVEQGEERVFVPGITVGDSDPVFVCGTMVVTPDGPKFVEGQIVKDDTIKRFVPGKTSVVDGGLQFQAAISLDDVVVQDPEYGIKVDESRIDSLNVDTEGVFGQMVHSAHGVEFFPGPVTALPAGKTVPGRLIRGKDIKFVPGIMVEGNFVPGQVVMTDNGEEFIPGQVVETGEGPKFVPGQIVQTKNGPKFVPGQTVQTAEGPKFVPGQIVETRAGPTFIPGQVIHTHEEGSKFVPGQVVDTAEGPRFVPGRVVEDGDRVTFVPGQVVETSEGLRFVAPDLMEGDGDDEFTVQGFEVSPEELRLIHPRTSNANAADVREMAIDSKMLRQLSEAGMAIGRQVPTDIPVVDIRCTPAVSTACGLANKLGLDPVSTAKVSQLLAAVVQLGKLGEIEGNTPEIATLNGFLERIVHCKTVEETYKVLTHIVEKEMGKNPGAIDKLHAFVVSKDSPLKRLNKVNILKEILNCQVDHEEMVDKLSSVLNEENVTVGSALRNFTENNPEIVDLIVQRVVETMGEVASEKEAVETLHRAVVATVREASEMSIVDLLKDAESLGLKELILEAVSLAKALDMTEAAISLLDILSNPRCTDILAGDRVTLEILKRLTVMKQLAQERPELLTALKNLQMDPYAARGDPSLRQLVRESAALLVIPEEGVSSRDLPASLMFSQNSLAMEEFLTRTKRACPILVIIKNGIQAVIPREAARSVLTGRVPYAVLDEKGIHQFQPKHVFSAIKLPKLALNWFPTYRCEIIEGIDSSEQKF